MAETICERCFITKRQAFIDPPPGHMAKEFTSADGSRKFYMYEAAQAGRHHFVKGCDPVPWEGDTACWLWYPPDVDLLETSIDTFERFQNREECVAAAWSKVLACRPERLLIHTVGAITVWCLDMSGGKHVLHRREVEQGWEVSHG